MRRHSHSVEYYVTMEFVPQIRLHNSGSCWCHAASQAVVQSEAILQVFSPNIRLVQDVDADGMSRPHQLPVASGVQRRRSMFAADIREARVCRDLSLAQLHQATGHVPRVHRHGLYHAAV